jgi:hypothetical protein
MFTAAAATEQNKTKIQTTKKKPYDQWTMQ